MQLIKLYTCLFALSVLALQPVWSAGKYLVPILPFILIFIGKAVAEITHRVRQCPYPKAILHESLLPGTMQGSEGKRGRVQRVMTWLTTPSLVILLAFFLCNAVWLGTRAVKQVGNNISYIKGDRYAGYPPEARKMFEAFERARGLPDSVVLVCRKPEILYIVSEGRQSVYPWQVEEIK